MRNIIFSVSLLLLISCKNKSLSSWEANHPAIHYFGRALLDKDKNIVLIGSASYVEINFSGDSCVLLLKNIASGENYNYVSIEVDNEYKERLKIDGDSSKPYIVKASLRGIDHLLRIYKATEAQNGQVALTGIKANDLKEFVSTLPMSIEFIGNSITCGMGNDISGVPCGSGQWYDQHNAYWAYGPRVARALGTDFMLSSVSGIGIYRTWNTEHPGMPLLYESAYLNVDSSQRWDFNNQVPDVVSICLGTNDLSDGDGKTPRAKFDSAIFVKGYIDFIGTIYKHYPDTRIVLLSSPMLSGEKAKTLYNCLQTVSKEIAKSFPTKAIIEIFQFKPMVPKGCSYHPDKNDHEILANELMPFFKQVLEKVK